VDTPSTAGPLAGAEERKVRAARRFGRIGLAITLVWLLFVPASAVFVEGFRPAASWPIYAVFLVAVGLHVWRVREHIRSLGGRAPLWFTITAAVVGLAVLALGVATSLFGAIWAVVTAVLLGDIVAGLRARWVVTWVLASTAVAMGVSLAASATQAIPDMPPWWPWFNAGLAAFYVLSIWTIDFERLWWLKAVTDMDDARRAAAELATARERLRLADDLHDILGHALEVVAFKSELASRLQDVDPERARTEMEEVQRVARQSLTEVRAMVRETRETDLVVELKGARAVLQSAGIALVVDGDPSTVGPTARNVLGRVLREAMTNVLRHAEPSHCSIEIAVAGGEARLRVVNDGALPADGTDAGTGLVALGRYLDEHAGRLDAGPAADGTFRLDAVLPAGAR
jgi:two-component system sensor histidine kinase DesK